MALLGDGQCGPTVPVGRGRRWRVAPRHLSDGDHRTTFRQPRSRGFACQARRLRRVTRDPVLFLPSLVYEARLKDDPP